MPPFDPSSLDGMRARLKAAMESSEIEPRLQLELVGCDNCRESGAPGFIVRKKRSIADRHRIVDALERCSCRQPTPVDPVGDMLAAAARGRRRRS